MITLDRSVADRIVLSRHTLARYRQMGLPPDAGPDLRRMFSDEIETLKTLKAEHGLTGVDTLIRDWEGLLALLRRGLN